MNKANARGRRRSARTNDINSYSKRRRPQIEPIESRILLSTYTVNTISDAANPGPGLLTLRQAVANSNTHTGADTINFDPKVFSAGSLHTITLQSGQISFSDKSGATTVNGPGAAVVAVNGHNASRVFSVGAGVTVNINGITVTGGLATGGNFGGGIFNAGTLTLNGVTVTKNKVDGTINAQMNQGTAGFGGGIYSTGGLTVQNSTLSSNSATGADDVLSGSGYVGQPAAGGGIYSTGSLTISSSVISSNSANGGNHQVAFAGGDAGDASGGGIYAAGALSISSSNITSNSALAGLSDADQISKAGDASGGGIYSTAKAASIVSSQISGNSANAGGGSNYGVSGGLAFGGGIYSSGALNVTSSNLSKNSANGADGVLSAGTPAQGGGIYCKGALALNQSTVSGNFANGGRDRYSLYNGAGGNAQGGGIFAASAINATGSSIIGNAATGGLGEEGQDPPPIDAGTGGQASGGGAWCTGSAIFTECTIANNKSQGGRGGDAISSRVPNGHAGDGGAADGGGIHAQASLQLRDSTVSGNTAIGGAGGAGYPSNDPYVPPVPAGKKGAASAGGVYATTVHPLFSNSIISANKANGAFRDIQGTAQASSGFNLIGTGGGLVNGVNGNHVGVNNPKLQALGNYGGPTQTMLPMVGSPAINAGSNALIPSGVSIDQRGLPRIFGSSVDIGADEYVSLTLSGSVFNDKNGDGIRQAGDLGLANWQVYIDLTNAGVFTSGDPVATTDAQGNYTLTYVPTSTQSLIIREIRQSSWRRTKPPGIYPLGFYTVSPTAGSVSHLDFGNSTTALMSGTVFNDANSNGKLDSGEKGLTGVRVYVDSNKDGKFESSERSTLTDSSGNWSLAGLAPGSYVIRVVQPSGFKATVPANGSLTVTLASGDTISGKLFGEHAI